MRITLKRFLAAAILTLTVAAPVAAQQPSQPLSGGDEQSVLVGAGLTFMNGGDETALGVAGNVLFNALTTSETGRIGIVADFGVNKFDFATLTTLMGGARYTFNTEGRIVPYGQFLVGLAHGYNDTDFIPALGFGLDVAWRENLNFRGELQFHFGDFDATRIFLGVSLPINK